MSGEVHVDPNPELTEKFRNTMQKTADEIRDAIANLDLSKEKSAEHLANLVESLQENADQRLSYLRRIRMENERLATLEQAQKGRVVHRDTKSLHEAARVTPSPVAVEPKEQ